MPKLKDYYNYDNERFAPLRNAAREVTGAFGAQNKWLDTMQEWLFIEAGMKHTSDIIHGIAHRALVYLDEFSDILHERHLATEYPATAELDERFEDPSEIFEAVVNVVDRTGEALKRLRDRANENDLAPLAIATESLMAKVSREQTVVLALWQMWDHGVSPTSFDNWALHYTEGGVE